MESKEIEKKIFDDFFYPGKGVYFAFNDETEYSKMVFLSLLITYYSRDKKCYYAFYQKDPFGIDYYIDQKGLKKGDIEEWDFAQFFDNNAMVKNRVIKNSIDYFNDVLKKDNIKNSIILLDSKIGEFVDQDQFKKDYLFKLQEWAINNNNMLIITQREKTLLNCLENTFNIEKNNDGAKVYFQNNNIELTEVSKYTFKIPSRLVEKKKFLSKL